MGREPGKHHGGHRKAGPRDDPNAERSRPPALGPWEAIDPEEFMPGSIFMVPDEIWGIAAVGRVDHPGLCTRYQCGVGESALLQGSGCSPAGWWKPRYVVEPTPGNGLRKRTAFELVPIGIQGRWLCWMYPGRWMGRLDSGDFQAIRCELERLFPDPAMI
jgi:hypothetical protein